MRARWLPTVFSLRNRACATSRLVIPEATRFATSPSRELSRSSPAGFAIPRVLRGTRWPRRRSSRAAASASRSAPQAEQSLQLAERAETRAGEHCRPRAEEGILDRARDLRCLARKL